MFRFLGFLVFFLVLLLVVGVFLGWVHISWINTKDQKETTTSVTIDKEKIKEDVDKLKNKVKDMPQKIKGEARNPAKEKEENAGKTVRGKVQAVSQDQLTVTTAKGRPLTLDLTGETAIQVGNRKGNVNDLHPGAAVTADYVDQENRHVAVSVHMED